MCDRDLAVIRELQEQNERLRGIIHRLQEIVTTPNESKDDFIARCRVVLSPKVQEESQ